MNSFTKKTIRLLILFLFSSQILAENQNQILSQSPPITKKLPEVKALSNGEVCVKKAATHSVAGLVGSVVVDCLVFACANTVIAVAVGVVGGAAEGCVEGILEH